jgi:3-deoxy-manno-octulosonate cytidylyltransferase (CMP-KDO synthetase)
MSLKVVIPSRFASSRLPGKPLVDLCGLPMVVRVYNQVKGALPDAECWVAVDDERIANVLTQHNIPWVMTAVDHESGTDRIAEVCRLNKWSSDTLIINVQGDEPLVPPAMLQAFADLLTNDSSIEMATVSAPVDSIKDLEDINVVKLICDQNNDAIYFSRYAIPCHRDGFKEGSSLEGFRRHIGVYAYRVGTLFNLSETNPVFIEESEKLEQLRAIWLGTKIRVLHWTKTPPHGVDTLEDVERVNTILKGNKDD